MLYSQSSRLNLYRNGVCVLGCRLLLACCLTPWLLSQPLVAQDKPAAATPPATPAASPEATESDTEKQERISAERFLELLKKRPRTGTALDKVYGYHIQNGTLDKFCDSLRKEANEKQSGESWMLLGMVQMQRGQDAEARLALEKAEELLPKEPMASFYLGKTLVLLGDLDQATAALERSIERKPAKADMLLVFQELGRLYQRLRRSEDALAVWNRMEKFFPGDAQVQEQIAVVLAEEGANAEALERFERLAKTTKDRFRKVEMAMRAAQLKESVGRRDEALSDFEKLLGQVNPDSWIYQDLRTRIDNVFLSRNDYDGLANYYTAWMDKHPEDIDAMLRVGRLLSVQRRTPEAKAWFAKAIERAPSETAPRLALVDALEREREFGPAADAMQALAEIQPDNPDTIVRWGELIFNNQDVPEAERSQAAAKVWKKLLEKRGEDPVTLARLADLLRGANLTEDAIAAYRKAISLAESEPQYREYLGEYLFRLNRKDEALTVWRELASGPRESRENLVRLSEVLSTFKLRDEALATMERACLDKPTFGQRMRYAEMLRDATKYDDALKQIALAGTLAETPDEQALLVDEQIKNYQANGKLTERIAELEHVTSADKKEDPKSWEMLALYQEADRKFQQAAESIKRAAELDAKSVALQTIAVRVQEKAGMFGDAIETLRKLTALDRRYFSNYLTQIASLQMRLGQVEEAIKTGQELVSATSANSEQFKFYADLCFQAGKNEQGLDALRRNVRSNPNDRDAMRNLARSLSSQFQTEEATELYWRSYATAPTIEEKRADVEAMTELYLRTNRFDQLVTRLTTWGREENRQREATLLVAAANQAAGDLGAARALLEPLLREESRDADLLATLIKLAQAEFDWEAASTYQKRLNEVAPSPEGDFQLARFYLEQGEISQAQAIWAQLASRVATVENVSQTVEKLISKGESDKAIELAEQSLAREPENWELMTTVMMTLWRANSRDRSLELAEKLLAMKVPFDAKSSLALKQQAQAARGNASANTAPSLAAQSVMYSMSRQGWLSRLSQNSRMILQSSDPYGAVYYSSSSRSIPTLLYCFGDSQAIALAIKQAAAAEKSPTETATAESMVTDALTSDNPEVLWNSLAKLQIASSSIAAARMQAGQPTPASAAKEKTKSPREQLLERLYAIGDREAGQLLLQAKYSARVSLLANNPSFSSGANQPGANRTEPNQPEGLTSEELVAIEKLFEDAKTNSNSSSLSTPQLLWLSDEYRLAKEETKADTFYAEAVAAAEKNAGSSYGSFLGRDRELALKLFTKSLERQLQTQRGATSSSSYYSTATFVNQLAADCKQPDEFKQLITEMKKVQVGLARNLRPSQLVSYNPTQAINASFVVNQSPGVPVTTNNIVRIQIDFPAASSLQSADLLVAMRTVQQSKNQELKKAVAAQLEEDAKSEDEEVLRSAVDRFCYATWLWWEDARAAAIEQMQEYRKLNVAPELGLVIESRMLYETKQIDAALALLDSLKPMNQQMLQDRELAILQLLLQKGDLTRSKQSAERLFALRLDSRTQMQVGDLMAQLGMREMAEAVLQRVKQRSGNDLNSQSMLMQKMQAAGNTSGAVEIARQLLRRTQPSMNSSIRTVDDSYRRTAVQVLVASGESKSMIASLESRLEKSPTSVSLVRQLAELYEATGKRKEAQEILGRLAKSGANDPQSLLAVARTLQGSGKHKEAVEAFLKVLEKQPDLLNNEYYNIRNSIQSGKQWSVFAEGIERIGFKRFRQTYRMTEIVSEVLQTKDSEVARRFLKSWIRESGITAVMELSGRFGAEYGVSMSSVIDDEMSKLIVDSLIVGFRADPGGVNMFQRRSSSSNGQVSTVLSLFGQLLKGRDSEYERLLGEVKLHSEKYPTMRIVEAAMISTRDVAKLNELMPAIIEEAKQSNSRGVSAAWPLASVLAHEGKHYQLAIDLLEPTIEKIGERDSGNGVDYMPSGLLIYCYTELGKNEKAKELLDDFIAKPNIDSSISISNPGYGEYQMFQVSVSAANKYLQMKYPIEALQLATKVRSDKDMLEKASRWGGSSQYMLQQLKRIEDQAKKQITAPMLEKVLKTELDPNPPEDAAKTSLLTTLIDVQFKESKTGEATTECLLTKLLADVAKDSDGEKSLLQSLDEAKKVSLMNRRLGQLHLLTCMANRLEDKELFQAIVKEILSREDSLQSASASTNLASDAAPVEKRDNRTDDVDKAKAKADAEFAANLAKCERLGLWIAVQRLQALEQTEDAQRLAKLAILGLDPSSLNGKKVTLQFARMQLAMKQNSEAAETLSKLLDDLVPKKAE